MATPSRNAPWSTRLVSEIVLRDVHLTAAHAPAYLSYMPGKTIQTGN